MHRRYEEHYQEMRRRLSVCCRTTPDPFWRLLQAAAIARRYRDRLPLVGVQVIPMAYFKEHLPRFEAEVQYYELRYEAERCRPEDADRSWAAFWLQEISRMTPLIEAHPELYGYFRNGGTDRDREFFTGDPEVSERHSVLWGSFMALVRYQAELGKIFTSFLQT